MDGDANTLMVGGISVTALIGLVYPAFRAFKRDARSDVEAKRFDDFQKSLLERLDKQDKQVFTLLKEREHMVNLVAELKAEIITLGRVIDALAKERDDAHKSLDSFKSTMNGVLTQVKELTDANKILARRAAAASSPSSQKEQKVNERPIVPQPPAKRA